MNVDFFYMCNVTYHPLHKKEDFSLPYNHHSMFKCVTADCPVILNSFSSYVNKRFLNKLEFTFSM